MTTTIHPPTECANLAADAIRRLNHDTIWPNDARGYRYPHDVYDTLGALVELLGALPQALEQARQFLERAHAAGRVYASDKGEPGPVIEGIAALIAAACEDLAEARAEVDFAHCAAATLGWVQA